MSGSGSSRTPDRTLPSRRRWSLALGAALLAVLWLLGQTPQWQQVEHETFDLFTTLSAPGRSDTPIVIVAIDEPSLQQLALQWPFPRRVHAALIDRIAADGPAAIGIDILFAEPSAPDDDAALAAAIARAGNVVLAMSHEAVESARSRAYMTIEPLPGLLAAGAVPGDVGVDPDADFVVRRMPAAIDGFAATVVARARGLAPARPDTPRLIKYAGPHGTFETVHYYQAVTPGLLPPGYFRGKIVLVGLAVRTSPELTRLQADLYNAPFFEPARRSIPGVEVHANVAAALLTGRALRPAPIGVEIALTLAVITLIGWSGLRSHPGHAVLVLAATLATTLVSCYVLFVATDYWLPPVFPAAAGTALYVAQTAVGFFTERRRASETRRAFAQFVPPEVVNELVAQPDLLKLGGEARELTILFADLADFTTFSEGRPPAAVVALLTEYLEAMSAVIYAHKGTVDKFIGDGIMAFWGAPLPDPAHALHAVHAAVDMQAAFARLARHRAGGGEAPLAMRIGLHTGTVVVGNIGSAERFAYTAIGDAVNLASRLEGANKAYGTSILLSAATARQLPDDVTLRPVDAIAVKGKREIIDTFTPCADAWLIERSAAARSAWQRGAPAEAAAIWREVLDRYPADTIAAAFLARIDRPAPERAG
jgi:adenylate cyclase